nr:sensor histidine kinase [Nocardioides thalensis]
MVRQAAAAARAAQLSDQLQASRERIVTAVEDERRRLRNELHDGLGPTLAAIASRIDTARITAQRAPTEADHALAAARGDISGLLAEVRRLVHGLRPPALDDVGLAGALRQQADRIRTPALSVTVDVAADLGPLPAAAEVAAFRIASEALTNAVRHSGAGHAHVRIDVRDQELVVEVADDGVGIGPDSLAGVGLSSMRERARELGGRCTVESSAAGGTRVTAHLPIREVAGGRVTAPAPRSEPAVTPQASMEVTL